jgi:hypothetical protein
MIIYFKRSNNNFGDILNDTNINSYIDFKISWLNHLLLSFADTMPAEIISYINIKYSDDMIDKTHIVKDRTPIIFKDYHPLSADKSKLRVVRTK